MNKNLFKRFLSVILIVALVLSSASLSWATEAGQTVSITDGQIVAANYKDSLGLSNEEIAILESTSIRGEVHTLTAPDAEEELITVDSEARSIVAREYKDAQGNVWIPESADVVYAEGSESIELKDGKGKFTYTGKNYSVEVTYNAYVEVRNQETLINTPYYLAKGVENLDILADDCSTYLMLMETIIPQMMQLVDGSMIVKLEEGSDASNAIIEFNRQLDQNGMLDLLYYLEGESGYMYAESKVKYLLTYGSDVEVCTKETYEYAKAIAEESYIQNIIKLAESISSLQSKAKQLKRAMQQIEIMVEVMAPVYEDDWRALDYSLLRSTADYRKLLEAMLPEGTAVSVADSDIDYAQLDKLVEAVIGKSVQHTFLAQNPLLAASTKIVSNVNRKDVTVKINANVIPDNQVDSSALGSLDGISTVVTLPEGASKDDVLEAISESGIEEKALQIWNYGISEEHYNRTATELPDKLDENITYIVTYSPKTYKMNFVYDESKNMEVPYGYNHTLEVAENSEVSYDYTINGNLYVQGDTYRVIGDTQILRSEGKAREGFKFASLIAEDYKDTLTDKEEAILNSEAVISDTLSVRIVDNNDENQIVIDGQTITAADYDAGTDRFVWKPVSANVIRDEEVIETVDLENNEANFESTNYEYIDVEYALTIKVGDDPLVREFLNLPAKLVEEAESQKSDMDELLTPAVYNNLGSLNKTMLNSMAGNLGEDSKNAIEYIKTKAFNGETGKFYLYEYLTSYKKDGLTFYYQDDNYARIREQVVILADQLAIVANDELLPSLLEDLGYGAYKDKIDDVVDKLTEMKNGFSAPNVAIDTESEQLSELVAVLEQKGTVNTYKEADGLEKTAVLKEAAANITFVNIEVNILKGNGQLSGKETTSISFVKGSVIDDTTLLTSTLASMEESLGIDKDYYTCMTEGILPGSGHVIERNVTVRYTWSPKEYSVSIDGTDTVLTFTYDDTRIALPLCEEPNRAYVYAIAGKEFEATVSNNVFEFAKEFTSEEFGEIFKDSAELVITRRVEDVVRRNLLELIEELNKAIAKEGLVDNDGNLMLAFIPVERNGELEVVLRLPFDNLGGNLMGALPTIAEEIITSKYSYVALNGSAFIDEGTVSLQAFIDMILANEGFGTGTILNAVDENGDIIELQLDNSVIVGEEDGQIPVSKSQINDTDLLGGLLFSVSMALGSSAEYVDYNVPFYITIEDFNQSAEKLLDLRNTVEATTKYMSIESHENTLTINRTLEDHQYADVLTRLIMEGRADISDISTISLEEMFNNEQDAIGDLLNNSDLNADTIKNTGIRNDISLINVIDDESLDKLLSFGKHFNNSCKFETVSSDNGTYTYNTKYSVDAFFKRYSIPNGFKNLLAESDGELVIPTKISLSNAAVSYEALVLDTSKSGSERLTLTTDVAGAVANAVEGTIVTLLKDVNSSISFNNSAVLNLNGKTVNGNISSDEMVTVIDNSGLASAVNGSVYGDFHITAGTYLSDVTEMIPEGYEQVNGQVRNSYYEIAKDVNGNYIISLDADYLTSTDSVSQKYLAVEMATDFAIKAYSFASLKASSVKIYDAPLSAVGVGLEEMANQAVESLNVNGIKNLANELLSDITDFSKVASSVRGDKELSSYVVVETPWDFHLSIEGEGDSKYIGTESVSGDNTRRKMLSIRIDGDDESETELSDMCAELKNIVSINSTNIDLSDISYVDNQLTSTATASMDMAMDFTSDNNYAIVMGIIVAYNTDNKELVSAIKEALSETMNRDSLIAELEKLTFSQLNSAIAATRDLRISDMAASLGIPAEAIEAGEEIYHNVLNMTNGFINRMDITVGNDTLAAYKVADSYAEYRIAKQDLNGTNLTLDIKLCEKSEIIVPTTPPTPTKTPVSTVSPGPSNTPVSTSTPVPTPLATPVPTGSGKISAEIVIDENSEYLYGGESIGTVILLDARCEGIDAEQFIENMVEFNVSEGRLLESETRFINGAEGGLVTNGTKIEVVMVTAGGQLQYDWFTVILKGDVNCDGKVNSTDIIIYADYWLGYNDTQLNDIQLNAADMDCKSTWNNTDAVLMSDKFFGYEYTSELKH